ncbi:MAG: hypothetical protein IPK76_19100 [Lewinellaceae bacterium]|nr:hypothetical protein [Lewinellaceae bacterium]
MRPTTIPPDQKQSIRSFVKINGGPQHSVLDLQRTQPQRPPLKIAQNINENIFDGLVSLEYTLRTGKNALLQITSKYARHYDQNSLQPQYVYYPFFFGLDSSFTHLEQNISRHQGENMFLGKYIFRNGSVTWQMECGTTQEWGRLISGIILEDSTGLSQTPDTNFHNDLRLQTTEYSARLSVAKEAGLWYIRCRLGIYYSPVELEEYPKPENNTRLWAVQPRLDIRYAIGDKTTLSGNYEFRQNTPNLTDYYGGFIFTDYQSVERGLPAIVQISGHSTSLRLAFNDRLKQFSWNISASAGRRDNQLGAKFQIDPFLFIQEKYRPVSSTNFSLNASTSRYFPMISSRLGLDFSTIDLEQENKVNSDIPRRINTYMHALGINYGTAFDTWFNVIFSNQITYSITNNTQKQLSSRFVTTNWFSSVQLIFKPPGRFDAKVYIYRSANRTGWSRYNIYYAASGICQFRLPKWRSDIRLSGVNLLNSRSFKQVFAGAFFQNTTTITAMPFFILVNWDYSF